MNITKFSGREGIHIFVQLFFICFFFFAFFSAMPSKLVDIYSEIIGGWVSGDEGLFSTP